MGTKKSYYRCSQCGYEAYKWLGRCSGCGSWNTMEETAAATSRGSSGVSFPELKVSPLKEVPVSQEERFATGIGEFDRVLGGGAVSGSVILIGGDPGIGKSTLLLQVAARLASSRKVLYATGEESLNQVKMRSQRLKIGEEIYVLAATRLEQLLAATGDLAPELLVLDSVQSFYSEEMEGVPGSVNQVRQVTAELVRLAKEKGVVVFLIGHVTKEGVMAGPRLLEHMVDCVLYLEGDRYHSFRILRGVKNRFGSTNEIGVFMMEEQGLAEVENPSHLFITGSGSQGSGAVVTAAMEGTRPVLVEIQSLVIASNYPSPRRTSAGIDLNRVALIMAVLEKHAAISFHGLDAFVNVVGGVRLVETAVDLALALSLVSGLKGKRVPADSIVIGEVGLTGEIRPVGRVRQRINEGKKLGFSRFILPQANLDDLAGDINREDKFILEGVAGIREAIDVAKL